MKRIIIIILSLVLLFNIAVAEQKPVFDSSSWLLNVETTIKSLIERDYLRPDYVVSLSEDETVYLVENESLGMQPTRKKDYQGYCFSASLHGFVKGKIAGFPIRDISLVFAYDGEYHLISTVIELLGADYESLKRKISQVHGEADKKLIENEQIESNVWYGTDNSAILLYTESGGLKYTLIYGRTDAEDILSKCLEVDPDDVSGL